MALPALDGQVFTALLAACSEPSESLAETWQSGGVSLGRGLFVLSMASVFIVVCVECA